MRGRADPSDARQVVGRISGEPYRVEVPLIGLSQLLKTGVSRILEPQAPLAVPEPEQPVDGAVLSGSAPPPVDTKVRLPGLESLLRLQSQLPVGLGIFAAGLTSTGSRPPERVEVLSNRLNLADLRESRRETWELFEKGELALRKHFPEAERLLIRHQNVTYVAYRVGKTGAPDGLEGRKVPAETFPALERTASLGVSGRTGRCLYASNDLVLDGLAHELLGAMPSNQDNVRGNNGIHYVAGLNLPGGAYALIDPTWPVSSDAERDQGWPQGVLVLADSRQDALKAGAVLYGSPLEAEPADPRLRH